MSILESVSGNVNGPKEGIGVVEGFTLGYCRKTEQGEYGFGAQSKELGSHFKHNKKIPGNLQENL